MKETEERKITEEERLLTLAIRYNGDYPAIRAATNIHRLGITTDAEKEKAIKRITKIGYKYTTSESKDYPIIFEELSEPPFVLFYKGNLKLLSNDFNNYLINVTGTKKHDKYGEKVTKQIVKDFVKKENTIVTGNNCGIESTVVETVIKEKGKIVIISSGGTNEKEDKTLNECLTFLKENDYSENDYLLISEYPDTIDSSIYDEDTYISDVKKFRQTRTKQITIGVCDKVLITAATRGTQQQSFQMATIMNKEIFIIPAPKSNKKLINNGLIESGAIAVTRADEIF